MSEYSFWTWFFIGIDDRPGLLSFFDWYIALYLLGAMAVYSSLPVPLSQAACSMMLPVCGLFFGVTFAWSGNITALLSSDEIDRLSDHVPGGLEFYAFQTQAVVLIVLTLGVAWGLAGLSVIENKKWYIPLLVLTAMALRECWNLVLMAQYLTLARRDVARISKQNGDNVSK